jgi:hypothetical protein
MDEEISEEPRSAPQLAPQIMLPELVELPDICAPELKNEGRQQGDEIARLKQSAEGEPSLEQDEVMLTQSQTELEPTDELEECHSEAEPEIDVESDHFEIGASGPDQSWVEMVRSIKPRAPNFPSPDQQRSRVRELLDVLDREPQEPNEDLVREARDLLAKLETLIPNHGEFVASGFSHCYPAWHELLKGAGRKSAKMVLGWVKNGFRPRFVGTAEAKPAKRKVVISMSSKIVSGKEIPELLKGKYPHRVEFENHQSLYRKWGFSSDQIVKLLEADAAGIWDDEEPPVVINPMGVVDSAGKDRMICNDRYLNLSSKLCRSDMNG